MANEYIFNIFTNSNSSCGLTELESPANTKPCSLASILTDRQDLQLYMDKFFTPTDKTTRIKWLLQTSIDTGWTIVLEYSLEETYKFLNEVGTEVPLPITSIHEYNSDCRLTAVINPIANDLIVDQIMVMTHALSVHSDKELLFLIADDYHEECFSGSKDFFTKYYQTLLDKNLVDIALADQNSHH